MGEEITIQLIHPVYLDVPMLMSFAAALEGGVSLASEVLSEHGTAEKSAKATSGKIGLSGLVSSLLSLSASHTRSGEESETAQEVVRESRAHTEASIAIALYDRLCAGKGTLVSVGAADDFDRIKPGALVEVSGRIEKNAVDAMIDYLGAMKIMVGLDTSAKPADSKNLVRQAEKIASALNEDRKRTPISNVLVRCSAPKGMTALLTLRTDNLRDLTLSELHHNDMRVVGKITRRVPAGDSVVAFENYGLGMLDAEALQDLFNSISKTEGMNTEFSDVRVRGPAVQMLPLMVFV